MLTRKQSDRSGRRMMAAALALGLGAGLAGAQVKVGDQDRAVTKAPEKQELRYLASGGFAAVEDRLSIRSDGRLEASREFLGRKELVQAFIQPEEVAALMEAFQVWVDRKETDLGKSEVWYEVVLRRGNQSVSKGAPRIDQYLARMRELHRKALDGELAEGGAIEMALPLGPGECLKGFTLREDRAIVWHLDAQGERVEDARIEVTEGERDRLKDALGFTEGDIRVEPTGQAPSSLRAFEVVHPRREEERERTPGKGEGSEEEVLLPARKAPVQEGGPIRLEAALRMIRG